VIGYTEVGKSAVKTAQAPSIGSRVNHRGWPSTNVPSFADRCKGCSPLNSLEVVFSVTSGSAGRVEWRITPTVSSVIVCAAHYS